MRGNNQSGSGQLVDEILADLEGESPEDFGCICEIDVSKTQQITKILQKVFDEYLEEMQKNEEAKKDEELKQ